MKFKYLVVSTTIVFGLLSCKEAKKNEEIIRPIKVAEVQSLSKVKKSFSGIVTADQFSDLAYKMSGPLLQMNVQEGQHVKKGDVIAVMDPTDYKLDYDAKKASFQKSMAAFERSKKLLSRNAISVQDYEASQAAYATAKSAYENSVNTLKETKLIAPFDGFIQKKYVENFQRVQPGQGIVCLINPKKLQIDFTIPETNINYITNPDEIYVEFDAYKGKLFKAKLKEYVKASIAGAGVPVSLNIVDENFNLDKYRISVGYSCRVYIDKINKDDVEEIMVPLSSIVFDNNTNSKTVFIYDKSSQTVKQHKVTDSGTIIDKENVIVKGDIKEGDVIVVAGSTRLVNGQKVKLLTE